MDPVEKIAALNRAWEAIRQIQDLEARFDAAKSRREIAELVTQVAEAKSAISVIRDAVTKKFLEINATLDDTPGSAPTYPEA